MFERPYLFVGGPHDGEWHVVLSVSDIQWDVPRETWTLSKYEPPRVLPLPSVGDPGVAKVTTYKRQAWNASATHSRWLFVEIDMTPDRVLDALLQGYRQAPRAT